MLSETLPRETIATPPDTLEALGMSAYESSGKTKTNTLNRMQMWSMMPDQTTLMLNSTAVRNVLATIHPRSAIVTNLGSSSGGLH